jgi:predicted branched-subunit amino acid permease
VAEGAPRAGGGGRVIPLQWFGRDRARARVRRDALLEGVWRAAPSLVATGVWGVVTGVAMVNSGLTPLQAAGMSLLVFAGSAQLAALPLMAAQAPIWVVLLTALVINLRFVIFSAALYPHLKHLPLGRRALLGYVTADFSFAVSMARWSKVPREERGAAEHLSFLIGATASTWIVWQVASLAGVALGAQIPTAWGLEFVTVVSLIALTLPMISSRPALVGVVTSGAVAVLAAPLPLRLGLVVAVIVGMAAAMAADIALEKS